MIGTLEIQFSGVRPMLSSTERREKLVKDDSSDL
jgi:hypothetical protein